MGSHKWFQGFHHLPHLVSSRFGMERVFQLAFLSTYSHLVRPATWKSADQKWAATTPTPTSARNCAPASAPSNRRLLRVNHGGNGEVGLDGGREGALRLRRLDPLKRTGHDSGWEGDGADEGTAG